MNNDFLKNDQEKPNIAILFDCPLALSEVARVMEYGAKNIIEKIGLWLRTKRDMKVQV